MRIMLIGSVVYSYAALKELLPYKDKIVGALGLDEKYSKEVSDYYPIHIFAKENSITSFAFKNINDNVEIIKSLKPDLIFVIGLSQVVSKEILSLPKFGCVGFHPTPLPKMRGRAPIPWMIILGIKKSAATLFYLDEGVDSGDIIDQENYDIGENDYAIDVYNKVLMALEKLIRKNVPLLLGNKAPRIQQDHSRATYLSKRTISDGLIDWGATAENIYKLVRAVSKPYPGAYTYYEGVKFIIWRAELIETQKYIGLPGQIVDVIGGNILVATGKGILGIKEFEFSEERKKKLRISHKFGLDFEEEIFFLKKKLLELESKKGGLK
jgi:methionyl-tRNA formyltransferase